MTIESRSNTDELVQFEGPSFSLTVPGGWLAVADQQYQASFIGPQIGSGRAGITVAMSRLSPEQTLETIVQSMRSQQSSTLEDYTLLLEAEPPDSDRPAVMRHYHWYNPQLDMTMIQRQLIVLTRNYAYAVTATQPNNPQRDSLDGMFMHVLNSFQVGELEI